MRDYVHGIFNVEKCVRYLRSIGVEVTPEMEQGWLDTQKTDRFLRSMKGVAAEGWDWTCKEGHITYIEAKRGRRRKGAVDVRCHCGLPLIGGRVRWVRLRDGTVQDWRPRSDRWRALDDPNYQPEIPTLGD